MHIADEWGIPFESNPWIHLPLVTQYIIETVDGKTCLTAARIERYSAPIKDMPSLRSLNPAVLAAMASYLRVKAAEEKGGAPPELPPIPGAIDADPELF